MTWPRTAKRSLSETHTAHDVWAVCITCFQHGRSSRFSVLTLPQSSIVRKPTKENNIANTYSHICMQRAS